MIKEGRQWALDLLMCICVTNPPSPCNFDIKSRKNDPGYFDKNLFYLKKFYDEKSVVFDFLKEPKFPEHMLINDSPIKEDIKNTQEDEAMLISDSDSDSLIVSYDTLEPKDYYTDYDVDLL